MSERPCIAIVSPGHPEFSKGGTQHASYALFENLKAREEVDVIYVARCPPELLGHAGSFAAFRGRPEEILWSPPAVDSFRLLSKSPAVLKRHATEFCERLKPDLIHLHHYYCFGTDLVRIFKEDLGIPVVLSLWEYLAVCARSGQMVKTNGQLCYTASHAECNACFPDRSSGKFFFRKEAIMENFSHVDVFIAPSHFLAQRYTEWGIEPSRIRVIENPLVNHRPDFFAPAVRESAPAPIASAGVIRIGYFGQFTQFKGIDVLLSAVGMLDDELRQRLRVLLFGFSLEKPEGAFQRAVAAQVEALKGCVVVRGPYRNENVNDLMQTVDWIVVPSIWWESYVIVISEAFAAGKPVLCSNIGLMQERVRPGVDGAHFMVGDSVDLADKLAAICRGELKVTPPPPPDQSATTADMVDVYREVLAHQKGRQNTQA